MGTWGPGNFDSDYALNWVQHEVLNPMAQRIEAILADPVACEWDEDGEAVLMPAVEVLTILARRLGFSASGVTSETVQRWKQKYLKVFDATFHTANGSEEFNAERRKVIVDTFEELEKLLL